MSILSLLQSKTLAEFESRKPAAQAQLETIFPAAAWGIDFECSEYTADNFNNLWNNELRKPIRHRLESQGLAQADYTGWLGKIHFINIGIYRRSVFPAHKSNIGWRVAILAMPAANVIVTGIASHYQGGQRHAQLGLASNLLFDAARDGLAGTGTGVSHKYTTPYGLVPIDEPLLVVLAMGSGRIDIPAIMPGMSIQFRFCTSNTL